MAEVVDLADELVEAIARLRARIKRSASRRVIAPP
jgi:hypothetical protein